MHTLVEWGEVVKTFKVVKAVKINEMHKLVKIVWYLIW